MAVPTFLASSHRYLRTNGVTDVDTIIADVLSELVTNGDPAWTEVSAGLYKSPVDADGRWFDILLTKIDADTLEMRVRDKNGTTVGTRRMDITAAGTDVLVCTGENHFGIVSLRATPEYLLAGMLDLSPEAQTAHLGYVFAGGYRDSGGSADSSGKFDWLCLLNINTSTYGANWYGEYPTTEGGHDISMTVSGAYTFRPFIAHGIAAGNVNRQFGRAHQMFIGQATLSAGTLYDVPIDTDVTAKFTKIGGAFGNVGLFIRAD